jgi:hypothetical protein
MATPKIVVDGSSAWEEAVANKFIASGGGKLQVKALHARVQYSGSAWQVVSSTDSAEIASGDLAWNGTNKELEITLSGYDNPPVVLATPAAIDAAYTVKAHASSATKAVVRFYNIDTGAKIATEDANMDCNVLVIGA